MIRVLPVRESRRDFARWCVAQVPKVRTVTPQEFAVPARLFLEVPERLLIGSFVDGHRYVSPEEDAERGTPPPEGRGGDLLGVATAAGLVAVEAADPVAVRQAMDAVLAAQDVATANAAARGVRAGEVLSGVAESAHGAGSVPPVAAPEITADGVLPTPDDSDSSDPSDSGPEVPQGVLPCPGCDREFTSARGLRMHRRQVHPEA